MTQMRLPKAHCLPVISIANDCLELGVPPRAVDVSIAFLLWGDHARGLR